MVVLDIKFKESNRGNFTRMDGRSIKYIVIHYTSNKGDTAKNNADYFAREVVGASAHYFVDEEEIYQSVLDKDKAWHCGSKTGYKHWECRNTNSIGIEICMNDRNGGLRATSIENSKELVVSLMRKYNIDIDHVIRHYDVTGKYCPGPMVDNDLLWENYKVGIEVMLNMEGGEEMVYKTINDVPDYGKDLVNKLIEVGALQGTGNGELDIPESMLRTLVILQRLGKLGL